MRTDRELAASLLQKAVDLGAEQAEAYIRRSRMLGAEAREGQFHALDNSVSLAYGVRVIREGRLGFSYSTETADADDVIERALSTMAFSGQDEFLALPMPEGGYPEAACHDPEVMGVAPERAVEYAKLVESAAYASDPRVKKTRKSSLSLSESHIFIANTHGLSAGYSSTFASAGITVVAEEGGDSQTGWGYDGGRFLCDIDMSRAGREAAERACSLLGAQRAATGKVDLIIDRAVAVDILSAAAAMLSAENVQKGKSLLEGRVGQRVISRKLNIVDDPLRPGSQALKPMDGEGVPARANTLVSEGVLIGFMHNTYTANKDRTRSTANAVRSGASSLPGVGPQGLILEASDDPVSMDTLIGSISRGVLVTDAMGVHTINPVSGAFSIGISGISIERGALGLPVREAVISGNILDFLGSVEAACDDLRYMGSMGSPSLLVTGVDLSA